MTKTFKQLRQSLKENKIVVDREKLLEEQYSSILLVESRIDFLNQQYASGIDTSHDPEAKHTKPEKIIGHFQKNADPTPGSIHTQKILNWYTKGPVENRVKQSDARDIHKTLSTFEAVKNRLPNKDLNSYKSLLDVKDAIAPHRNYAKEVAVASKQVDSNIDVGESLGLNKIYDKDGVKGYQVPTKTAAKKAFSQSGKVYKTSWCTATNTEAYNAFDRYNDAGKLHTLVLPKGKGAINIHHEHNEIRDEENRSFSPEKYGEYEKNIREFVTKTDPMKGGKKSGIANTHGTYDVSSLSEDINKIHSAHDKMKEDIIQHRNANPNGSYEDSRKEILSRLNGGYNTQQRNTGEVVKRIPLDDDTFNKALDLGLHEKLAQNPSLKPHHIDKLLGA